MDYLLDSMLRHAQGEWGYKNGGSGNFGIVDKAGRVFWGGRTVYKSDLPKERASRVARTMTNMTHPLRWEQVLRALHADRLLARLLRNQGRIPANPEQAAFDIKHPRWLEYLEGEIVGVEKATGQLTFKAKERDEPIIARILPDSRIVSPDGGIRHGIDAVQTGKFEVAFSPSDEESRTVRFIRSTPIGIHQFWLTGKVKSVDSDSGDVTVVLDQPGETPGLRYWKEEIKKGKIKPGDHGRNGNWTPHALKVLQTLNAMSVEDRTTVFRNDAALTVFLDGQPAKPSQLKAGMPCCMSFANPAEAKLGNVMHAEIIRAIRLPEQNAHK
jgi:hypothetical protein